jgi:predicted dehydrogenase
MKKPQSGPRIAVIGGGHLGRIHAKLLASRSDCQVVCVADPEPRSRELVSTQLGLPVIADYRDLDNKIDGAIVAAPTFLHAEIGSWLLSRNIHCFMEKPIAASTAEADTLVNLARRHGCTLQVGHVERFNPVWTTACEQVNDDSVRYIEAIREGTYTGRSTDIGIVLDLMIHDIDLILSLVPSPVAQVHAYGWAVLGSHEDFAVAHLRFKNGALAQIRASRVSESQRRCMQIFDDSGAHSLDFVAGTVTHTTPQADVAAGTKQADRLTFADRLKVKDALFHEWLCKTEIKPASINAIEAEHREFLSSVAFRTPVTVSGATARTALGVAEEILIAMQTRSADPSVIPLPQRFAA